MSRKTCQPHSPLASSEAGVMALGGLKRTGKHSHRNHSHNSDSEDASHNRKRYHSGDESSSTHSVNNEGAGDEGSESNLAGSEDDDEVDDDCTDAAAFAPSSRAEKNTADQTGPINKAIACVVKQSHRSASAREPSIQRGRTLRRECEVGKQSQYDDDDYTAVDMISDSDEDGRNVEQLEEEAIIESEEADKNQASPSLLNTSLEGVEDGWGGMELDNGVFMADVPYFEEQLGRTDSSILANEADPFNSTDVFESFSPAPLQLPSSRHVRFAVPHSEDSDAISDDDNLNALFQPPCSGSNEDYSALDQGDQSFYDFDDDACGSSSGYETDYGDTTDEEDAPAAPKSATTRPEALTRMPSYSSPGISLPSTPVSTQTSFRTPATPASSRPGPRIHTFTASSRKPVATIDVSGEFMVIYGLKRLADKQPEITRSATSTGTNTPTSASCFPAPTLAAAPDFSDNDYSDFVSQAPTDPVLGTGTEMAMAGLYQTGLLSPQTRDPEASPISMCFPTSGLDTAGAIYDDEQDYGESEAELNVNDFIDFGEDSSDDEVAIQASQSSPQRTPPSTSSHDFVKHFDPKIISAFRRGQSSSHSSARGPQSAMSLKTHAFKGGLHAAADVCLSPQRKRKIHDAFGSKTPFSVAPKRRVLNFH